MGGGGGGADDAPGEGGDEEAGGFEGAGDFGHDAAGEFVLRHEFEGVGLVDEFSVLGLFEDELEFLHGAGGDFDFVWPGAFGGGEAGGGG